MDDKMATNRGHILVVEDSRTQAEQLRHLLEKHGFRVRVAVDAAAALAAIAQDRPDLVLSDIVMPGMDGYQLCRKIKATKGCAAVPVILVTSLGDPKDVVRGLQCGADNFVTKPYDEGAILRRVEFLLASRHLDPREMASLRLQVNFAGEEYQIDSHRMQIVNMLLSSYEAAVQRDGELLKAQEELRRLNEELEDRVRQRTVDLTHEIAERKRAEDEIRQACTRESAIGEVLCLSLETLPLDCLLERALDSVLAVPDLAIERRGAVFLVEDAPDILVLKVSRGLAQPLLAACARVPFGKCLCGRAAASGQVEFADCLDERHETRFAGIHPHGHYCVPIRLGNRTIGVLNLYVQAGHTRDAGLERTLVGIADALAGVVVRRQVEAQRDEHLQELQRWDAVTLGRENRVLELKREVNELLAQAGQPPRYVSAAGGRDVTAGCGARPESDPCNKGSRPER